MPARIVKREKERLATETAWSEPVAGAAGTDRSIRPRSTGAGTRSARQVNRGGGGGGGGTNAGAGGSGGGGNGGTDTANAGVSSGAANTGGGGGGCGTRTGDNPAACGNGGSGVAMIRYSDTFAAAATTTGSPTYTVSGGFRLYKWTGNGSITF